METQTVACSGFSLFVAQRPWAWRIHFCQGSYPKGQLRCLLVFHLYNVKFASFLVVGTLALEASLILKRTKTVQEEQLAPLTDICLVQNTFTSIRPAWYVSNLSRPSTKLILGTLRSYDGDGDGDFKKTVGLMSKTSTLHDHHAFLDIFLSSLPNYDVK